MPLRCRGGRGPSRIPPSWAARESSGSVCYLFTTKYLLGDFAALRAARRARVRATFLREALRIKLLRARRRRAQGSRVAGFVIMAQARLARRHAGRAAGSQLVQHHAPWRNLTSKHLDAGASHMRCTRCKVQPGAPTTVMHQGAGAHRWWCTAVHGAPRCMEMQEGQKCGVYLST